MDLIEPAASSSAQLPAQTAQLVEGLFDALSLVCWKWCPCWHAVRRGKTSPIKFKTCIGHDELIPEIFVHLACHAGSILLPRGSR